ncbi:MAG TPA: hypothetical protein VNX68_06175, partial [Nitrosopumilaceae archaeon]|nr:hypothetical protein [Nitrosopumilaceae archaeon]
MKIEKFIFTSSLFLLSFSSLCQKAYIDGIIITQKNDSLRVKINEKRSESGVRYIDNSGEKRKLAAGEIKGYILTVDSVKYSSVWIKSPRKRRLLKVVSSGEVNVLVSSKEVYSYVVDNPQGMSAFNSTATGSMMGRGHSSAPATQEKFYLQKKGNDEKAEKVPMMTFKKFLKR